VILCINTPWYYDYNKNLKENALPKAGFVDVSDGTEIPTCEWINAGGVRKAGVWRGQYGYHNATAYGEEASRPSEETLGRIAAVLEDTYPSSEIAMICVFTVACPILFVTFVALCCMPRRYSF